MQQQGLGDIIAAHRFFKDLDPSFPELVSGCAKNVRFGVGDYLFHEGDGAAAFYLIRHGRVSLEIKAPGRQSMQFMTVGEGDIVGISWLVPPYCWSYDAKALELVRAIALDATCLRDKCETDNHLGYELMKRFVPELALRLHCTRLQLLDLYGKPT
ncbi:MAG: cyclic nucleotide-binding domain-containing protein [Alphaproteobacteria bacterium]|nr:cyclic nucleotide-binding domain-containing protein [Alphaproteobacteria bacterium]